MSGLNPSSFHPCSAAPLSPPHGAREELVISAGGKASNDGGRQLVLSQSYNNIVQSLMYLLLCFPLPVLCWSLLHIPC
jgi:hypothetical protein